MESKNIKKQALLSALEQTLGVVSEACRQTGIARQNYYRWMREDPEFAQAVEEIQGVALDVVEGALYEQIKQGNITAIIFYLKCKGKSRGYVEKMEITPAEINVNIVDVEKTSLEYTLPTLQ